MAWILRKRTDWDRKAFRRGIDQSVRLETRRMAGVVLGAAALHALVSFAMISGL